MSYKVKLRKHNPRGQVVGEFGPFTTQKIALKQAQVVADSGDLANGILVTVEKTPQRRKNTGENKIRAQIQQDLTAAFLIALKKDSITPAQLEQNKIAWGSRLLDGYKASPGSVGFHAIRQKYFGGYSGPTPAREWLQSVTDARWDTLIRASAKEAIARHKGKRKNPSSRSYKGHKIKGKTGNYTVDPYGYDFPTLKAAKAWLDKHVRDAYPKPKKATTKRRKNTKPRKNGKFKRGDRVEAKDKTSGWGRIYKYDGEIFRVLGDDEYSVRFESIGRYGPDKHLHVHGSDLKHYTRKNGSLPSVDVIFANPKYNYTTNVSATTTAGKARDYFVGQWFDMGTYPNENMQQVIDVKFYRTNTRRTRKNPRPKVKIQREGYERKGYWMTSSTGKRTYVKPTYIAATEFKITDPGRPGVRSFGAKSAGEGYKANSGKFYLAQNIKLETPLLDLLPAFYLDNDSEYAGELTGGGFRYAEFPNTGYRVIVRPKKNRRWLNAWNIYVTDFEVYEVDTVSNSAGTGIKTSVGKKHPKIKRLFSNAKILKTAALQNPKKSKRPTKKENPWKSWHPQSSHPGFDSRLAHTFKVGDRVKIRPKSAKKPRLKGIAARPHPLNIGTVVIDDPRQGGGLLIDWPGGGGHDVYPEDLMLVKNPRKSKRPTKKEIEARRYMKPLITREGKLGGAGYTKRTVGARHTILDKCVTKWGYRSCLGSLLVLLKNSAMKQRARGVITRDKNWLEKKYGGPGSFGPQSRRR